VWSYHRLVWSYHNREGNKMAIAPGTKVVITIEATVMQAFDGSPVHVSYGEGNENTMVITQFDLRNGVTVRTA
jgi:hypothetical protein